MVGVRSKVPGADLALVTVFYEATFQPSDGIPLDGNYNRRLLLSKESTAPVAGANAYGGTHDNFIIPLKAVKFIRVKLLRVLGDSEFKP